MSYNPEPFHPFDKYEGQVPAELEQANENFKILAQVFKDNDPTNLVVKTVPYTYNADKVINAFADTPYFLPYPIFTVLTDGKLPQYGQPYSVYYTMPDNKLYWTDGTSQFGGKIFKADGSSVPNGYGSGNDWFEIDWTKWIANDPWYRAGKLRIYNGELQVSNNRKDWFKVIPTVGETLLFRVDPDPEYNYSTPYNGENYILYLAPGQSVILQNIYTQYFNVACVSSSCWRCSVYNYHGDLRLYGIMPSGVSVDGLCRSRGIVNAYSENTDTEPESNDTITTIGAGGGLEDVSISDSNNTEVVNIDEYGGMYITCLNCNDGKNKTNYKVDTIAPVFEGLSFVPITMARDENINNFDIFVNEEVKPYDDFDAPILVFSMEADRMFIVSNGDLGFVDSLLIDVSGMCVFTGAGAFPKDGYYIGRHVFLTDTMDTLSTGVNGEADKVVITRMF
jgi:hypothetical protein